MKSRLGPYPNRAFPKQVAANVLPPLVATVSGELTTNVTGKPMGAVRFPGRVSDVWLSVGGSGKDDTNTLQVAGDVLINGTTCLSTNPVIAHVSGEAAQQKTTKNDADTGVTQAVLSTSNTVSQGDVITYSLTLTRTTSPTTEMRNVAVVVEFEPSF